MRDEGIDKVNDSFVSEFDSLGSMENLDPSDLTLNPDKAVYSLDHLGHI